MKSAWKVCAILFLASGLVAQTSPEPKPKKTITQRTAENSPNGIAIAANSPTIKAVMQAMIAPNKTAAPNRWVEGNSEKLKIPKPNTITRVKVSTGCQKRCLTSAQASSSFLFCCFCLR